MKKVSFFLAVILILSTVLTSCGASDSSVSTKTFHSGYHYMFFKDDHSLEIYQKASSSSYARGCAADGKWIIEGGKVKVEVTQDYCDESNAKFNGIYKLNGNCLENDQFSLCCD